MIVTLDDGVVDGGGPRVDNYRYCRSADEGCALFVPNRRGIYTGKNNASTTVLKIASQAGRWQPREAPFDSAFGFGMDSSLFAAAAAAVASSSSFVALFSLALLAGFFAPGSVGFLMANTTIRRPTMIVKLNDANCFINFRAC